MMDMTDEEVRILASRMSARAIHMVCQTCKLREFEDCTERKLASGKDCLVPDGTIHVLDEVVL